MLIFSNKNGTNLSTARRTIRSGDVSMSVGTNSSPVSPWIVFLIINDDSSWRWKFRYSVGNNALKISDPYFLKVESNTVYLLIINFDLCDVKLITVTREVYIGIMINLWFVCHNLWLPILSYGPYDMIW